MNRILLQNVNMLYLLWVIPLLVAVYIYAWQQKRKALSLFIDAGILNKIDIPVSYTKRIWKTVAILAGIVLIIIAMARPGWNLKPETIERRGRDVVFVLDVSKSMLAEDLVPNRLERAKLAISDCIDTLKGDRVALVAFAGTAAVKCPLTLDYGFFRMMLNRITPDSISRGGTMIGDAIRKTLSDVFDNQEKQFKDIILITDGEDHDSFPVEAAKKAGDAGIRLIAIGLGDENEGKRIPITNENGKKTFLKYKGREVWTKLDGDTLRKMVNATPGGKYLNVATGVIDLGTVYNQLIATAEKKSLKSETIKRYEEKFQIFLAFALLILCIEMVTSDRKGKNNKYTAAMILAMTCVILGASPYAYAGSPSKLVQEGNQAYVMGKYDQALSAYEKASVDMPESARIYFNKGAAFYKKEDYAKAKEAFKKAAVKTKDIKLEAAAKFNLGNCDFKEAKKQQDSDLNKAIKDCENSVRHYQAALELDPDLKEAGENIEIVRLVMKDILDKIKKEKEKEKAAKKAKDEIKKLIAKQQELINRNQYLSEDKNKKKNSKQLKDRLLQLAKDQKKLEDETGKLAKSIPASKAKAPTPSDMAKGHLSKAKKHQSDAVEKLEKYQTDTALDYQKKSLKELKKALTSNKKESGKKGQGKNNKKSKGQKKAGTSNKGKENHQKDKAANKPENPGKQDVKKDQKAMTGIADDAQNILNKEKENQKRRRLNNFGGGYSNVDKNW